MPFRADLNFFYLYLRMHLKDKHNIECERADHRVLTIPLLEKIRNYILEADVIISDITGRNANVFYELGLAHAYERKVILLTQDDVNDTPSDIRHFEFIRYSLDEHTTVLEKLDKAISNLFVERYRTLFDSAAEVLTEFNRATGSKEESASLEDFRARVLVAERTQTIPAEPVRLREFLLPRILRNSGDFETMRRVTNWLGEQAAWESTANGSKSPVP